MKNHQDEGLPAEGRHLFDGLVQEQLRRVKVQVLFHVVTVFALLSATLNLKEIKNG